MNAPQPRIIAIETSGRIGSVALALGPTVLDEREFSADMQHARELLPVADRLCLSHGWPPGTIEHCYLSIGPGSFTGLRVGVTFARHLAMAAGARVCAVATPDVIVQNAAALCPPPPKVAVILDAKRGQVFGAAYAWESDGYRCVGPPQLTDPLPLLAGHGPTAVMGDGVDYHAAAAAESGATVLDRSMWRPRASAVHRLGWAMAQRNEFTPPLELTPCYLRRPEAEEVWERRHGVDDAARPGDGGPR